MKRLTQKRAPLPKDLRGKHRIAHDGYNLGRDLIVEKATSGSSYLNRRYETRVDWVEGLLPPGNEGECVRGISPSGLPVFPRTAKGGKGDLTRLCTRSQGWRMALRRMAGLPS